MATWPTKFYAQFHGPIRSTQAEAERDYDEIVGTLNQHRPDLVPLALHDKVAGKGTDWKDRG